MKNLILFLAAMMAGFVLVLTFRVCSHWIGERTALPVGDGVIAPAPIRMMVQWGGYYVTKDEYGYSVFRLLDVNPEAYHIAVYDRRFRRRPEFSDVYTLVPSNPHVALEGIDLLSTAPELIGKKELKDDELNAYRAYLYSRGIRGIKQFALIEQVKQSSREEPLLTMLSTDEKGLLRFGPAE